MQAQRTRRNPRKNIWEELDQQRFARDTPDISAILAQRAAVSIHHRDALACPIIRRKPVQHQTLSVASYQGWMRVSSIMLMPFGKVTNVLLRLPGTLAACRSGG